jgi:hypothetical protein
VNTSLTHLGQLLIKSEAKNLFWGLVLSHEIGHMLSYRAPSSTKRLLESKNIKNCPLLGSNKRVTGPFNTFIYLNSLKVIKFLAIKIARLEKVTPTHRKSM